MMHRFCRVSITLAVAVGAGLSPAYSQSKEDRATVEKARLAYLTQPVPTSIACGVELDWDRFFQEMKIPMDDATKARLDKVKAMKISVVSKGATETEVKLEGAEGSNQLGEGIRNQLSGFFQMYWPESYGKMLTVKPADAFDLLKTPEGYEMKITSGGTKVELHMDKSYAITSETVESPQMNAVMKTGFKPGPDGLLRLRSLENAIALGETKMVINVALDYQKVGEFEVPQHLRMELPGSFGFNYTFVGCEVKGSEVDVPVSKK